MNCPRCGNKAKPSGKEWNYHVFDVKSFYCESCNKRFNAYYREGKLKHTIPKAKLK